MGYGLIHGLVALQEDELGIHGPARGIRVEIEQAAQFVGVFAGQLFQQGVAVVLVQFVQHVGGVVRGHFGNNLGGNVCIQIFQHVNGHVAVKFGQGVGGIFLGHAGKRAHLLFKAEIFQMIGHVGRVDKLLIRIIGVVGVIAERGVPGRFVLL